MSLGPRRVSQQAHELIEKEMAMRAMLDFDEVNGEPDDGEEEDIEAAAPEDDEAIATTENRSTPVVTAVDY